MECDGHFKLNDTSNIVILPCSYKVFPSTFGSNICIFSLISIKIIYLKYVKMEIMNQNQNMALVFTIFKVIMMLNIEKRNSYEKKQFPPLNVYDGKIPPYGRKGVFDPNICQP